MHILKCELHCAALFRYAEYVYIECILKIKLKTKKKTKQNCTNVQRYRNQALLLVLSNIGISDTLI